MKPDEYPNLLIRKELVKPLNKSIKMIKDVLSNLDPKLPVPLLRGAFVIGVSYFEIGLSDSLKYYLIQFPKKLNKENLHFSKDEFVSNYFRLLESAIEKNVITQTYKSFPEFFDKFIETISLDFVEKNDIVADIQEIRATRNLLLHNNLTINDLYIEQAGKKKRSENKSGILPFDFNYVSSSIQKIITIEELLIESMNQKYRNYTVIEANKRLWNFLFDSPVMKFEDYWVIDEENDCIRAFKDNEYIGSLSSSEQMLLGLWRLHFHGYFDLNYFNMRHMDQRRKDHVLYFLSIASEFPFS